MVALLRSLILISILFANHSAFADNSCRTSVKKRPDLNSLFETREVFDQNWKAWLAEKADRGEPSISRYLPEDRDLSRWQFFNKRMAPEVREILVLARPEFLNDQILPTPLEFTNAMIQLYTQRGISESDWILPGVILQSSAKPKEFKAFTYLEISKKWPVGFQVPVGSIPDMVFNRALFSGVMPLHLKTDIHPKFKMHMVYHDLHHLGSFLNKEYLSIFRHFYKFVYNRVDTQTWAKKYVADYFSDHGGYSFIEEFWRVPSQRFEQLNALLKFFTKKHGEGLEEAQQIKIQEVQYAFVLDRKYVQMLSGIDARVSSLKEKVRAAGKSEFNPVREWPVQLQAERAKIIDDFAKAVEPIFQILDQVQQFYEFNIHRIGATVSDQMSFRDPIYSFSGDYNRNLRAIRYTLKEDFARLLKVDWNHLDRSFAELMLPLVASVQSTPEQIKQELEERVKKINF